MFFLSGRETNDEAAENLSFQKNQRGFFYIYKKCIKHQSSWRNKFFLEETEKKRVSWITERHLFITFYLSLSLYWFISCCSAGNWQECQRSFTASSEKHHPPGKSPRFTERLKVSWKHLCRTAASLKASPVKFLWTFGPWARVRKETDPYEALVYIPGGYFLAFSFLVFYI